jgi:hypothetical protein
MHIKPMRQLGEQGSSELLIVDSADVALVLIVFRITCRCS